VGWITVNHRQAWCAGVTSIFTSLGSVAGTSIKDDLGFQVQSPLNNFSKGHIRLVSSCIRVAYDSTMLNTEGHYIGVTVPAGTVYGLNETEALSLLRLPREAIRFGETYCSLQTPLLVNSSAGATGVQWAWFPTALEPPPESLHCTNAIMIRAANSDSFTWTVDNVYEYVPVYDFNGALSMPAVASQMTRTPADSVGLDAATMAIEQAKLAGYMRHQKSLGDRITSAADNLLGAARTGAQLYNRAQELRRIVGSVAGAASGILESPATPSEALEVLAGLALAKRAPKRELAAPDEQENEPATVMGWRRR
jgi:hypothetical protein